jgi:hypothetical protein
MFLQLSMLLIGYLSVDNIPRKLQHFASKFCWEERDERWEEWEWWKVKSAPLYFNYRTLRGGT